MSKFVESLRYDFGPGISSATVLEAVEYHVSAQLALPRRGAFSDELEARYEHMLADSFTTALEFLSVLPFYRAILLGAQNAVYRRYPTPNRRADDIYVEAASHLARKLAESETRTRDPDAVYTAYLAVTTLATLLRSGRGDCAEYVGLTPSEILDVYGIARARSENIDQATVHMLNARGLLDPLVFDAIDHPRSTADIVRRKHFRAYTAALERIKKTSIFTVYFETIVAKAYPHLAAAKDIITGQLALLSPTQQNALVDRVYKLHQLGLIATTVTVDIPTETDIVAVEAFVPPPHRSVVFDAATSDLSETWLNYTAPIGARGELYIDGMRFPTIAHYVYYVLIGKRYVFLKNTDGTYTDIPVLPAKYILISEPERTFNRSIAYNELHGVGAKITADLAQAGPADFSATAKDMFAADIDRMCHKAAARIRTNPDLPAPTIPAAIKWVNHRMKHMRRVLGELGINLEALPAAQRAAMQRLLVGDCVPPSDSGNIMENIKQTLYAMMCSVLALNSVIMPADVVDYARRHTVLPSAKSTIPRSIRFPVLAVKTIVDGLAQVMDADDYRRAQLAILVLTDKTADGIDEVYNDYTALIARALGISERAAALVNGFASTIQLGDDSVYRRIVFYSSM